MHKLTKFFKKLKTTLLNDLMDTIYPHSLRWTKNRRLRDTTNFHDNHPSPGSNADKRLEYGPGDYRTGYRDSYHNIRFLNYHRK